MLDINATTASTTCEYYGQYSHPKMISWNKSSADCCRWDGITCNEITGHVIALDLSCSRLMGVIHQNSTLFRLSQLQMLDLALNDFSGSEISANFGGLTSLTHLNLSHTGFQGLIPPKISHLSKLVLLDLSNGYGLRINPHDFDLLLQNLTHIRVLSLDSVDISTTLPVNWSSSLTYLHLGNTGVHGRLSNSIFHLPRLQTLILGGNNLTIGSQKSNCSTNPSLWVLNLSYTNFLSEGIHGLISSLPSLKSLNVSGCQLSGAFPNSIGNLSQIVQLDLRDNHFNGSIPFIISYLPKLTTLVLSYNSFTGQFPSHIGNLTELTKLDLESNLLSGSFPSNMTGLKKLRYISLENNAFNGTIPSWFFSSPSLRNLLLRNNYFTGEIKKFESRSLEYVDFSDNQLDGPIPNSISKLLNLLHLDLSSNNLSGFIELTLFSNLKKLKCLFLSNNKLSLKIDNNMYISFPNLSWLGLSSCEIKEFPNFLKNSKNLEYVELSNNKLRGQIPDWIPWHSLSNLNLSHNSISSLGHPFEIAPSVKHLQVLDLRSNKFQEPLPLFICSMEELYILDLSHNNFTGIIPECFGNFSSKLAVLNLAKNDLKGVISMTFSKDNQLVSLNLNGNLLEGPLPRSLANCKKLEVLDVGYNNINDTFSTIFGSLEELQILILKSNKFSGSLSNLKSENFLPKLRVFDLSRNEFLGALPPKLLKSLKAMTNFSRIEPEASYMDNYNNVYHLHPIFYHDSMTIVMKGFELEFTRILTTLVVIDLSSNSFTGDIPEVIGNLNSLIQLNLSHNKFSGHIPSTLGELKVLQSLDLSWNQIKGEIPWQLADLTSLQILNLSQNRLVGRIPQGKQFNTFLNDSYYGNLGLCGFPVTKACGETDLPLLPSQRSFQGDEDSSFWSVFTLKSVFIGYGFGLSIGFLVFFTGKPKCLVRNVEEVCWYGLLWLGKKKYMSHLE